MSETVSTGLESGLVISLRYRVDERLDGEPTGYAGLDIERQLPVVVLDVNAATAKLLAKAKDLGHTHLANVLEVAELDGKHLVVCEQVGGETPSANASPRSGKKRRSTPFARHCAWPTRCRRYTKPAARMAPCTRRTWCSARTAATHQCSS